MTGLLSVFLLASAVVEANLSDGQQLVGELTSIDAAAVRIAVDGTDRTFDVSGVEKLEFQDASPALSPSDAIVEISDGSVFVARSVRTVGKGNAEIVTGGGSPITCPIQLLRSIRRFQGNGELDEQWNDILANADSEDFLVINKKGNLDYLAGIVVEIHDDKVVFDYSGNKLDISIDRVAGLVFARKSESFGTATTILTTTNGSVWRSRSARSQDAKLQLTSVGGATQRIPIDGVVSIEFVRADVVFATDLEPTSIKYQPYLGSDLVSNSLRLLGLPQQDKSFRGEPIRVVSERGKLKSFKRGLAVQSRSQLTYRLAGKYKRFQATVGLDPEAPPEGNVELRLFADDKEVFRQAISKSDNAIELDLPMSDVNRMKILVDFGKNLDIGDRLHLGDARFIE